MKVKQVAEEKHVNMAQLSRRADISYNTVQSLFRDPEHDVSLYILSRIAQALQVRICDLIEEDE